MSVGEKCGEKLHWEIKKCGEIKHQLIVIDKWDIYVIPFTGSLACLCPYSLLSELENIV